MIARAIEWIDGKIRILDQSRLPREQIFTDLENYSDVILAINEMRIRGAPAIGVTAAYGVVIAAMHRFGESPEHWKQNIEEDLHVLAQSRPTAVNLFWAINIMRAQVNDRSRDPDYRARDRDVLENSNLEQEK